MHIVIDHSTTYRYGAAARRVHQALRLWPIPGVGQVIRDRHGIVGHTEDPLPPAYFVHPTELTRPDDAIRALASGCRAEEDGDVARLHRLCNTVRERVDYQPLVTHVASAAADALAHGAGVCQDHAHVLIAAARVLGYPARYVSGYLAASAGSDAASHAWAEIHVPDLGWVGFDAANRICPDERYVRIAIGRDYRDAAPVRGVQLGGEAESMEVAVWVSEQ